MPRARVADLPIEYVQPLRPLSRAAAELWARVVREYPTDYFGESSRPLLRTYCQAAVEAGRLRDAAEKLSGRLRRDDLAKRRILLDMADQQERLLASAATKLRLTAQSQRPPPLAPRAAGAAKAAAVDDPQLAWEGWLGGGNGDPIQ